MANNLADRQAHALQDSAISVMRAYEVRTPRDLLDEATSTALLDALAARMDAWRGSRFELIRSVFGQAQRGGVNTAALLDAIEARGLDDGQIRAILDQARAEYPADRNKGVRRAAELIDALPSAPVLGPIAATVQSWRQLRNGRTALAVFGANNRAGAGVGGAVAGPIGLILQAVSAALTAAEPAIQAALDREATRILTLLLSGPVVSPAPTGDEDARDGSARTRPRPPPPPRVPLSAARGPALGTRPGQPAAPTIIAEAAPTPPSRALLVVLGLGAAALLVSLFGGSRRG